MAVVALENDPYCTAATSKLNHKDSNICTTVERDFLKVMEGGCTAPIGALAEIIGEKLHFMGAVFSLNGRSKAEINKSVTKDEWKTAGERFAKTLLESGGKDIMDDIRAKS